VEREFRATTALRHSVWPEGGFSERMFGWRGGDSFAAAPVTHGFQWCIVVRLPRFRPPRGSKVLSESDPEYKPTH